MKINIDDFYSWHMYGIFLGIHDYASKLPTEKEGRDFIHGWSEYSLKNWLTSNGYQEISDRLIMDAQYCEFFWDRYFQLFPKENEGL